MKHFVLVVLLVISLGLIGCGGGVPENEKLNLVKTGMSKQEVTELIGPPDLTEDHKLGNLKAEKCFYDGDKTRGFKVTLVFLKGELISKSGNFGK